MSTGHPITTTQIAIQKELKNLAAFRRFSSNIIRQFAMNLSLVAHGIRSGYLLDLFAPRDPVHLFSRLLSALRSKIKVLFGHVVHVYEPTSGQSFFINTTLLAERMEEILRPLAVPVPDAESAGGRMTQKYPVFIYLGSSIKPLDSVPAGVTHLLEAFQGLNATVTSTSISSNNTNTDDNAAGAEASPLSLSLPEDTDMPDAVALAAVLLDYPVAYVPSREHANVLAGIPLYFYEGLLKIPYPGATDQPEGGRIAFTKFSCPSEMQGAGVDGDLLPENIVTWLTGLFERRLRHSGYQDARVEIIHTVQVLDHVTF